VRKRSEERERGKGREREGEIGRKRERGRGRGREFKSRLPECVAVLVFVHPISCNTQVFLPAHNSFNSSTPLFSPSLFIILTTFISPLTVPHFPHLLSSIYLLFFLQHAHIVPSPDLSPRSHRNVRHGCGTRCLYR
jgi:hypothetical protein